MFLEGFIKWRKKREKLKFSRLVSANLKPLWLFDRGGYVWNITPDRFIRITSDQIGNWIVYDGLRMVSGYLRTPQEAKNFAQLHIANEIIMRYYRHLNN